MGSGSNQVVLKSGPKRPKLENVTLAQWSVTNLAILYKLHGEVKLTEEGLPVIHNKNLPASSKIQFSLSIAVCQGVQEASMCS